MELGQLPNEERIIGRLFELREYTDRCFLHSAILTAWFGMICHSVTFRFGITPQPTIEPEPAGGKPMSIIKIQAVLDAHGVPNFIAAGRIFADSMGAFTAPFEEIEDLTDYSRAELFAWLGY